VRNVRLRNLTAAEFHASILAILRAARRFDTRALVHRCDFQTAPTKLRSRGRLFGAKVRNVISDFLAPIFWTCSWSLASESENRA
jgi:hypothetical protein